jgi:hypothetical protein
VATIAGTWNHVHDCNERVAKYSDGEYATCIAPPAATVITKSESSIDDNSLFTDDGFDRYMYSTGKASKVNRWFEI